jgi:Tfp pilus assembly protein PilX
MVDLEGMGFMDRKGAALALVLLVVMVVVILANVALSIMNSQSRITHHQVRRLQAYYAAQGAMNVAFDRLRAGNTADFSMCPNAGACAAPFGGNAVLDPDLPFRVDVTIGNAGSSIDGVGRTVIINTNYAPQ